jgi:serine/threonine protein phosphatase 1
MGRIIAIGDIHGCAVAFDALIEVVKPRPEDTVITLGDYVDRGPDVRGVLDRLLALEKRCHLIPLLGNHEQMMLLVCDGRRELLSDWRLSGGEITLACYGRHVPEEVPARHMEFLRNCRLIYQTEHHFFVHGNYEAAKPLDDQDPYVVLWDSLKRRVPRKHFSGKTAVIGHSRQKSGEILDLGYLKCIDTDCDGSGWLTALDVGCARIWQVNKIGKLRRR